MIQRFLYTAIQNGLDTLKSDPSLLDPLFSELWGLSDEEVTAIKTFFVEKTPGVLHNYARPDGPMPVYSIVLADEKEDIHFVGESAGIVQDLTDPDYGADCYASIWAHEYHILCYSEHPDVTLYMYEVLKNILMGSSENLLEENLFNIHISGGDLSPDPRYIPEHLFVRRLTFSCNRTFVTTDVESKLQKAFRIEGIHVDKSGSPSDVGDVKTLVTPYTAGEDNA